MRHMHAKSSVITIYSNYILINIVLRYLSSAYIKHEQILFFVHFHFANHPVLTNFEIDEEHAQNTAG
jgi:hypothetical protein